MNENIENKARDTEGDLAVCDDVEKNDAQQALKKNFMVTLVHLIII